MKLKSCRIDVVMLPTRRVHRWTGIGANVIGHYPIIRLKSSDGLEGLGEAPVMPTWGGDYGRYYGEDIDIVIHVVKDILFPLAKSLDDVSDIPSILDEMDKVIVGYPYAKAAFDMALHDILRAFGRKTCLRHSWGKRLATRFWYATASVSWIQRHLRLKRRVL